MKDCEFCNLSLREEQKILIQNDYCMFLQAPQEVLVGSGLIVPIAHRETVFDLSEEEWLATYSLLKRGKSILDERYQPEGYNVGWNCNPVGGQHIMHAHLHVIPRFKEEYYAGKGIRHWIKGTENKHKKGM